jgi:hypothetical protein
MSERDEWMQLIRDEYDQAPSHYKMGDDWDDGAGRLADAILADKILLLRKHAEQIEQAKKSILAATIGSCDCNTKSPEAAYHAAHCRYLKLLQAMDCLDDVVEVPQKQEPQMMQNPDGSTTWTDNAGSETR